MIRIRKDNNEKVVTKGAYENLYKSLGYDIINENRQTFEKEVEKEEYKEDKGKKESYSRK